MYVGVMRCCKLRNEFMAAAWWGFRGIKALKYLSLFTPSENINSLKQKKLCRLVLNASSTPIYFKIKIYKDSVWKLNHKIEFFLPSTGHQNYLDKSLFDSENTCSNAFIVNFEGESEHFLTETEVLEWHHVLTLSKFKKWSKEFLVDFEYLLCSKATKGHVKNT